MSIDPKLACWEGDYNFYAFTIAIPSLILWGAGSPVAAVLYMTHYYKKGTLFNFEKAKKSIFLYLGYKK